MSDIEILEKVIKRNKFIIECAGNNLQPIDLQLQEETQAIENLLENSRKIIELNYIPKSKVKEKIEVLKMKADYDWIYKYDYQEVIKILQELLEGE